MVFTAEPMNREDNAMTRNMSNLDRRLRTYLLMPAAAVVGVLVGPGSVASIVLYVIAAVMLATGTVGYCPLYALLRIGGGRQHPSAQ